MPHFSGLKHPKKRGLKNFPKIFRQFSPIMKKPTQPVATGGQSARATCVWTEKLSTRVLTRDKNLAFLANVPRADWVKRHACTRGLGQASRLRRVAAPGAPIANVAKRATFLQRRAITRACKVTVHTNHARADWVKRHACTRGVVLFGVVWYNRYIIIYHCISTYTIIPIHKGAAI